MAFEKRKPTEEEVKYLESFDISCPYGPSSRFKEVYCDTDRNFYMFYIHGPGYEEEHLPMYFGIVWNDKPMILGFYTYADGKPLDGLHVKWKLQSIKGNNNEYIPLNDETRSIIKEALIAANGCRSAKVFDNEFDF